VPQAAGTRIAASGAQVRADPALGNARRPLALAILRRGRVRDDQRRDEREDISKASKRDSAWQGDSDGSGASHIHGPPSVATFIGGPWRPEYPGIGQPQSRAHLDGCDADLALTLGEVPVTGGEECRARHFRSIWMCFIAACDLVFRLAANHSHTSASGGATIDQALDVHQPGPRGRARAREGRYCGIPRPYRAHRRSGRR
jgi:hypothetical protein